MTGKGFLSRRLWFVALAVVLAGVIGVRMTSFLDTLPGRAEAYMYLAHWNEALAKVLIGNPMPSGVGVSSKVVVVADEAQAKALTPVLQRLLLTPVRTPEPEQVFNIVYAYPEALGDFKAYRNVILAGSASAPGPFGDALRSLLPESPRQGADLVIRHDVWAKDQVVIGIAGADAQSVADQAELNGDRVVAAMDASMDKWLTGILYHAGEDTAASNRLGRRLGWQMRVPIGFQVIMEKADSNFVVMSRQIDRRQMWVWVYWEKGISPDQLTPDWCLDKRKAVVKRFFAGEQAVFGDVAIHQVNFVGKLAVCMQGLWEDAKAWQGGPFKCYALIDVDQGRFYLIDMGIYGPNRTKALQMRQLDVLTHTFQIDPVYAMKE